MHPTQKQVTETVTTRRVTTTPGTASMSGTADTVRDVLLAAATYLVEHGWNQHTYYADTHTATPAACTVGALSMVSYGYPAEAPMSNHQHPAHDVFAAALGHAGAYIDATHGDSRCGTVGFNDTNGRTADEVIAMLRDAAAWAVGPRCSCTGELMSPDAVRPYFLGGDALVGDDCICRVYVCTACGASQYVDVVDPDDVLVVRAAFRQWVLKQPHDGAPHIAGCSDDCDTCHEYCHCVPGVLLCILHGEDEDLSSASWHVPGDPQFGTAQGAALGGAE